MKAQQLLTGLVVFALLGTTQLNAQVQTSLIKTHQGVRAKQNADPASLPSSVKAVNISSRLIGMNFRIFNGAFYESTDSFAFTFSNNRGGDLNSEFLLYDNGYLWRYDPGTSTYYNFERATQTFDLNNNPILQTYLLWDVASKSWTNEARYLNTYDSRHNILTSISQTWDISALNWRNNYQSIYTYNSNNQQVTEIHQLWNTSSDGWINIDKYTDTYTPNSNMASQLYQNWDDASQTWINSNLVQMTYDALNRMLTYSNQVWNTASAVWENDIQYAYVYDNYGDEVSDLFQTWNTQSNSWSNYSRHLYSYENGNIVSIRNLLSDLYEVWDSSAWTHVTNVIYTYNASNDRLTEMHEIYNNTTSTWTNLYLYTSTYDDSHNQLSQLEQTWSVADNNFVNSSMVERSFNKYNQLSSLITNTWNPGGFWQPLTSDIQENFYYEEYGATAVNNLQSPASISIYPSPAENFVNIDIAWNNNQSAVISIFDVMGKLYTQWEVAKTDTYHRSLSVSDFPAGNYFIRISGEKDKIAKQFVVLH